MASSPTNSQTNGRGMPQDHVIHLPKKRTIIKDRVGCVKTSTYDLPRDGFSFGRKSIEGVEGAGDSKSCPIFHLLFFDFIMFSLQLSRIG